MAANIHHPNDDLVNAIVEAWKEGVDKPSLITSPKDALARHNIILDNPVVVTEADYSSGFYPASGTDFFVLPQKPGGLKNNASDKAHLATARAKMAITPFGI